MNIAHSIAMKGQMRGDSTHFAFFDDYKSVMPNTHYLYQVKMREGPTAAFVESCASNIIEIKTPPLPKPFDLKAKDHPTPNHIELSWELDKTGVVYVVERKDITNDFPPVIIKEGITYNFNTILEDSFIADQYSSFAHPVMQNTKYRYRVYTKKDYDAPKEYISDVAEIEITPRPLSADFIKDNPVAPSWLDVDPISSTRIHFKILVKNPVHSPYSQPSFYIVQRKNITDGEKDYKITAILNAWKWVKDAKNIKNYDGSVSPVIQQPAYANGEYLDETLPNKKYLYKIYGSRYGELLPGAQARLINEDEIEVNTCCPSLLPPRNLTAVTDYPYSARLPRGITLEWPWRDYSQDTGFKIERLVVGGQQFQQIAVLNPKDLKIIDPGATESPKKVIYTDRDLEDYNTGYFYRISAFDRNLQSGYSNIAYAFHIISPSVTVTSPNGGETWAQGTTQKITWNTSNISSPNDKITIYVASAANLVSHCNIAQSIQNTGSYNFLVGDPSTYCDNAKNNPLYRFGNKFKVLVCARASGSDDRCSYAKDYSDDTFTIVAQAQGNIVSATDGATPVSRVVSGGQQIQAAKFKFDTLYDSYTITELKFAFVDSASSAAVLSAVLKDGDTVLTNVAYDSISNFFRFTGLNISVPANTRKVLTINLTLSNAISSTTGTSGKNVKMSLISFKAKNSQGAKTTDTNVRTGNDIYVYKSYPTISKVAVPSVTLSAGTTFDLYSWKIAADPKGNVDVKQIKFNIGWGQALGHTPGLYALKLLKDGTDVSSLVTIIDEDGHDLKTAAAANGANSNSSDIIISFGSEDVIPAGTASNYTLRATASGFSASTGSVVDSVSISMPTDSAISGAKYLVKSASDNLVKLSGSATGSGQDANLIWSDDSAISHNSTPNSSSNDWSNGYLIPSLPLASQTFLASTTQPSITVTSPNGGETLIQGQKYDIKWSYQNGAYGLNGSVYVNIINDAVDSTNSIAIKSPVEPLDMINGKYSWTVPIQNSNIPTGSKYKIRIVWTSSGGTVEDSSDNYFTIVAAAQPTITVTSPNGGETWRVGETHNITWTATGNIGCVNVYLRQNMADNTNGTLLNPTAICTNSFAWIIPSSLSPGTNYSIRILSVANSSIVGDTNYFTIAAAAQPSITVTSPNGYEKLTIGQTVNITWQANGINSLRIDLAKYSYPGAGQYTIASNVLPASGSYSWTVPSLSNPLVTPGDSYKIVIYGYNQTNLQIASDSSDNYFTISAAQTIPINSISVDSSNNVHFSFSRQASSCLQMKDSLGNYFSLNSGYYSYSCANSTLFSGYQTELSIPQSSFTKAITVGQYYQVCNYDTRGSSFNVCSSPIMVTSSTQPTITVTSPNGGETWRVGETHRITWNSNNVNNVRIYIYDDTIYGSGSTNYIVPNNNYVPASQGYYDWAVGQLVGLPGQNTLPRNYKIRVDSMDNGDNVIVRDYSDNYFTIAAAAQPTITVTSPNGGETWRVGETHDITWTGTNIPSNGAITIAAENIANRVNTYIFSEIGNSGNVTWKIPSNMPLGNYKMRISCGERGTERYCSPDGTITTNPNAQDYSDNYFTIAAAAQPTITVTSPNGGETWRIGETHDITWTSTGFDSTATARIQLYTVTDSTALLKTLAPSAPNTGSYTWTVPSIRLGKFKVKVLLTGTVGGSTTSKLDFSDNTFKILNVVSPSAAAVLAPSALASISEALSKIVEGLARILNR